MTRIKNELHEFFLLGCLCLGLAGCGSGPTFATAWSPDPDPAQAGRQAAEKAIAKLGPVPLKGLMFTVYYQQKDFTSGDPTKYLPDTQAELAAARAIAEVASKSSPKTSTPSLGCRARGLSRGGTLIKRGVLVLAIGGDQIRCTTTVAPILADRQAIAKRIARGLSRLGGQLKLIFLMSEMKLNFDNSQGAGPEGFIRTLLGNSPRGVVVLGGNSMNDPASTGQDRLAGAVFVNGEVKKNCVGAMGLAGPVRVYSAQADEFKPAGKSVLVTEARGKWVVSLNEKPAAAVYREIRRMGQAERFTCDWQHPVGVVCGPGERHLEMILNWVGKNGLDKDAKPSKLPPGSLRFGAEIAAGNRLKILTGGDNALAILKSAKQATADALAKAREDKAKPALLLAVSCCTRDMRLRAFGKGRSDEVRDGILPTLDKAKTPIFGFYSYGGLGPLGGKFQKLSHAFQNHTFLAAILAAEE